MSEEMFDLSIIIVSYHAVDFLKLTLDSVEKAISTINAEVLLVDNSNNDSLKNTISNNYPYVNIVDNNLNLGFAKGNNLALKKAKGKLALLLNPDTIVPEDAFIGMVNYYNTHPTTGGLGCKMIDGKGQFLKESKRGFPSLSASFFKLFRFHKLFPHSKTIAKYYEGHLDKNKEQIVDVLSGACMVIPRGNDNQFSYFDESYFMYGEDIDLSYRLKLKHGKNIYLPHISIIHFKGQSTQSNPRNIWYFYNAMWLFYKAHIKKDKSLLTTNCTWIGIKLLTQHRIFITKLAHLITNKEKLPHFESVNFISTNNACAKVMEKKLNTPVNISNQPIQSTSKQLIIFDFNNISYKQAIQQMERNIGSYGFLTHDQHSLIICQKPGEKGIVVQL